MAVGVFEDGGGGEEVVDVVVGVGEGGWWWAGVEAVEVHFCPFHYAEDAVGLFFC